MKGNAVFFAALLGLFACAAGMVIITAGDLPEPVNECSKGPEYWCQNLRTAKSCRATKHCIQTVWERQSVPEDNDDICTICKNMVQEARDQLLSNETQEEMKEVFEGSCKLIPIKMVRVNCIKMVDDFVPELIEMLASQMNPTMVCTTAWLCNNQWVDGLQAEYQAAQKTKPDESPAAVEEGSCGQCKAFMTHNAKKLKVSSLQDVQRVMFGICGQLNSYSDACMALVADNIEKIYDYLGEKIDEEACNPLGFCPGEKPMRVSIQPLSNDKKFEAKMEKTALIKKGGEDLECEFCQALIKNLRNILISNTTEAEFVTVLRSICQQAGNFAQQCTGIVDMYAETIYSFIVDELDPVQACRLLTLCPIPGLKQEFKVPQSYLRIEPEGRDTIPATKIMPAQKVAQEKDNDALLSPLPIERLVPEVLYLNEEPKKPGCILCEYVLKEVVAELRNSTVEEETETTLKTICHRLPLPIGNECAKMVDQYGDAILYMLAQELDPSVLCVELQMCPAAPTAEVELPKIPFKSQAKDPNACALCEFVVTMAEHKLENNHTEESVRKTLENICQHMPKSVRQDCTNLVDAYAKQIIEMLVAEFTPDEVCVGLKLCNPKLFAGVSAGTEDELDNAIDSGITVGEFLEKIKKGDKKPVESKSSVGNTPMCVMCEFAMATLEKRILNNNTEEEVKRAIDFLCAHLPETVADMCIDFIEEYGDEIFKMITGQIAPKAVCIQLGICVPEDAPPTQKLLGHKFEHSSNVELSMPSKCEICEVVVEYLDKLLQDDAIEASIDHVIEKACVVIPHGARDRCTAMVETYGPYFISQLGQMMDKTKVCQSLHLCKPPAGLVQLLGGVQCTWGPSYWCLSSQHASACNAVEHCQKQVWMKSEP